MGYHVREIKKGNLGFSSKIQEELDELKDAEEQNNRVLALCELSDLVGAIKAYMVQQFPTLTLNDLEKMADATKRAFEDGSRK